MIALSVVLLVDADGINPEVSLRVLLLHSVEEFP